MAPHSRHTETRRADLEELSDVQILSDSPEAGVYMAGTKDGRHIFITGHSEYDPLTLKNEYDRDVRKALPVICRETTTQTMIRLKHQWFCGGPTRVCFFQTG